MMTLRFSFLFLFEFCFTLNAIILYFSLICPYTGNIISYLFKKFKEFKQIVDNFKQILKNFKQIAKTCKRIVGYRSLILRAIYLQQTFL